MYSCHVSAPAVPRVQICLHEGAACHPDTRDQADTAYLRAFLTRFIRAKFPGVEPRVAVEESCMYTMTPDENPVIDTVPGTNIVIGVGFSGNITCSLSVTWAWEFWTFRRQKLLNFRYI